MSAAYRAVLFDFFGTLTRAVRRGPAHDVIARQLGCDPQAFVRALDETFLQRSIGALGDPATALGVVARMAGGLPSRCTIDRMLTERLDAITADTRLRPEAAPVLELLRHGGLQTGVISDCGPELPVLMPTMSIAPYIDTCVYSVEVGARKPDPIMYLTACERLDVTPAECLYIGDGGSRELSGAGAVGMSALRLEAPDLGNHLVFDVDAGWCGPHIDCLTEVFEAVRARRQSAAGGRTIGAVSASGSGRQTPSGPGCSLAILACNCKMPCSSASGLGGHPGT